MLVHCHWLLGDLSGIRHQEVIDWSENRLGIILH